MLRNVFAAYPSLEVVGFSFARLDLLAFLAPLPRLPAQLMAVLTTPLAPLLGSQVRQAGTFLVVMALGIANIYIK